MKFNEKQFSTFLDWLDCLVIRLSPDYSIIEINQVALSLYEWRKQDIIGKNLLTLLQKYRLQSPLPEKLSFNKDQELPSEIQTTFNKNGKEISVSWKMRTLTDEDNSSEIILMGQDMTHQKDLEDKVYELDSIVSQMPGNVYWYDKNFKYLGGNENSAKTLGMSRSEVVGKDLRTLLTHIKDLPKAVFDGWVTDALDVMNSKIPKLDIEEGPFIGPNQEVIYTLGNKVPLFNRKGDIYGMLGISTEITKRKQMEAALQEAKEKAEIANVAKTQFIANISHDIRTPLVGIQGIARLLIKNVPDHLKAEMHAIIHASTNLLNLLNEVISFAKLETGETQAKIIPFDCKKLLHNIEMMISPIAKKKKLQLSCYYADDIPTRFIGNPTYLNRILLNLVSNALKFTNKGSIKVKIEADKNYKVKDDLRALKITVTDTGIGIPEDKYEEIFKSFTRLNPAYEGVYKGSGLGLHITQQFVEQLGGSITIDSQINQGSTFTVYLRLHAITSEDQQTLVKSDTGEDSTQLWESIENDSPGYQLEIVQTITREEALAYALLVEDNLMIQKVTTMTLNDIGCFVDIAANGNSALQMASEQTYDIIFMDVGLPDIDGCSVSDTIRQQPDNPNAVTPIIALTAHMDAANKEQCINAGMDTVITKPLTEPQGRNLLKRYLNIDTNLRESNTVATQGEKNMAISSCSPEAVDEKSVPAVIDLADGAKILGKNQAEARAMLDLFFKTLPKEKAAIESAFAQKDWVQLKNLAHRFHGSTCFCGVPALRQAIQRLEMALLDKNDKTIMQLYQQFTQALQAFIEAYPKLPD